jgi:hypothetical protein
VAIDRGEAWTDMQRYKGLIVLLICCAGLSPHSHGQPHGQPFKAEARVTQAVVKNGTMFPVFTEVRNVSAEEQILYIWPCNYRAAWATDNALVRVDTATCMQDSPVIVRLRPGKAYVQDVLVYVDLPRNRGGQKLSFRLGYGTKAAPLKSHPPSGVPIPNYGSKAYLGTSLPWPYIPPIWSDPVTVTVER